MAEYYFISQLPSLDGVGENAPIPITEEYFLDLCGRFLDEFALREIENFTLVPPKSAENSNSPLIAAWNETERALRLALGKVRADKLNKSFDAGSKNLSPELIKVASSAVEIKNPLEAEKFLLHQRLNHLEMLRPTEVFSKEYIFYYAVKLKLLLRMKQFDTELGKAKYKDIYDSIFNGDKMGA